MRRNNIAFCWFTAASASKKLCACPHNELMLQYWCQQTPADSIASETMSAVNALPACCDGWQMLSVGDQSVITRSPLLVATQLPALGTVAVSENEMHHHKQLHIYLQAAAARCHRSSSATISVKWL